MYLKILSFNFLLKRFYFKDDKIYFLKVFTINSNFKLLKKDRLRVFIRNFIKLENLIGFKPVIKKIYAKKIDKKKIDLFCVLKTWINFEKFGDIFFDFIFVYFINFFRIINRCYKSKCLLFYRRPFIRKLWSGRNFQVYIKNFFNLVGISRKRRFRLVKNSKKFVSLNFLFFRRLRSSRIFKKSIKKLILKFRKKYLKNEKT